MDAPSGPTEVADTLVQDLNDLLASLSLPIVIETPHDLTPSLLLAILESILRERLPISNATRESRTPSAKVEAMKVFLGILEDDVLKTDIGLSEIDPRRLAAGEWDEVVFVGETLCWLGCHRGRMHQAPASEHTADTLSASSRANTSADTGFSRYEASETTATTLPSWDLGSVTPTGTRRPQCIHEFDISSFFFDAHSADEDELCDCSVDPHRSLDSKSDDDHESEDALSGHPIMTGSRTSVRYHGLIRPVKDEIKEFEAWQERTRSRSAMKTPKNITPRRPSTILHNPTRHTSPKQYTLALLNERARLLEELANINVANAGNR